MPCCGDALMFYFVFNSLFPLAVELHDAGQLSHMSIPLAILACTPMISTHIQNEIILRFTGLLTTYRPSNFTVKEAFGLVCELVGLNHCSVSF